MARPTVSPDRIRQLKAAGFRVAREEWEECGGDPNFPAGTIRHGWFYIGPGGDAERDRGDIDYCSKRRAWDAASRDHEAPPWRGRAREEWLDAYRRARIDSGVKAWVRACFPRGWIVPAAKRRLQLFELTGAPLPGHVAPMLALAAMYRREGLAHHAREYLHWAHRANAARRLLPSPAFGA